MSRLIHAARILLPKQGRKILFLRQAAPNEYTWTKVCEENEKLTEEITEITALTISEALRLGIRKWKNASFTTIKCGTRFTLPERDEHGAPALLNQMAASYSTPNGVYVDENYGLCLVNNASIEALNLWRKLRAENRL
jgi:hypothetical protein